MVIMDVAMGRCGGSGDSGGCDDSGGSDNG